MKVRKWLCLLLSLVLLLSLAGCGAQSKEAAGMDKNTAGDMMASGETAPGVYDNAQTSGAPQSEKRKWIVTVNITAETEDMDTLLSQLDTQIGAMEGYVENQNIHNGSAYTGRSRYRSAELTIRIPADRVDEFVNRVDGISNIVSSGQNRVDVTLTYADIEGRLNALRAEEARLLELMAQAENMTDLLQIEGRLTDVRYQLESAASQLKIYDNQVDYATVYLSISEVQEYTPTVEKSVWQRISEGFIRSLKGLWNLLVELFIFVLVASPYLAVVAGILMLVIRLRKRVPRKPKAPKVPPAPPEE